MELLITNSRRARPMPSFGSCPKVKAVSGLPTFIMIFMPPGILGMKSKSPLAAGMPADWSWEISQKAM
eukprot:9183725-Heterocapsa_arctica.AAC.1